MRWLRSPALRLAVVYLAMGAVAIGLGTHVSFLAYSLDTGGTRWLGLEQGWSDWGGFCYSVNRFSAGLNAALIATPFVAAFGALARVIARARVSAGEVDPLARVRAFAEKHVALTVVSPALVWLVYSTVHYVLYEEPFYNVRPYFVMATLLVAPVQMLLTYIALPALLAPTQDEAKAPVLAADDFDFAAVALTREATLAVKGLATLTFVTVAGLLAVPTFDNVGLDLGVALYVALSLSLAVYFRRASRISVGLDGVHVRGSSRSRFYAFGDLDEVRTDGGTIELLRAGTVTLRLQLHGPDASRRDALVERLSTAIARAAAERDSPVTRFVNIATREDLARVADGSASYRQAAVSRDQLWAALEGPAVASVARVAAAEVLARNPDPSERARFRVAAERCAEPASRARLRELLEDDDEANDEAAGSLSQAAGSSITKRAPFV